MLRQRWHAHTAHAALAALSPITTIVVGIGQLRRQNCCGHCILIGEAPSSAIHIGEAPSLWVRALGSL